MTLIDGESNDSPKWDTRDNKQDNRLNSFHAVWDASSTSGSVVLLVFWQCFLLSFPFYHFPFIIAFIIAVVLLAMSPFIIALHRGKDERGHVTLNKHLAFFKFCLYEVAAEHFIATF